MPPDLLQARSVLFVPADRPERFDKAVASGADMIILDLEDAVAPDARTGARNAASAWLTEGGQAILRVNAPGTPWAAEDETLADLPGGPGGEPRHSLRCRRQEAMFRTEVTL